jgi:hypothetical protein
MRAANPQTSERKRVADNSHCIDVICLIRMFCSTIIGFPCVLVLLYTLLIIIPQKGDLQISLGFLESGVFAIKRYQEKKYRVVPF